MYFKFLCWGDNVYNNGNNSEMENAFAKLNVGVGVLK